MHLKSLYLCILMSVSASSLADGAVPKRLIYWGWDAPSPEDLDPPLNLFNRMTALPFDGYVIYMRQGVWIFDPTDFQDTIGFNRAAATLAGYRDRFAAAGEQNFLNVRITTGDWDWFNPGYWTAAMRNLGMIAGAVQTAGLPGIFFDGETYGPQPPSLPPVWGPWACPPLAGTISGTWVPCNAERYTYFANQVRLRGTAFGNAFHATAPNAIIFTNWMLSILDGYLNPSVPPPPDWRGDSQYALLVPFLEGLLQSNAPISIVDGHESYYTKNAQEYADDTSHVHNRDRVFIDFGQPDPDPLRQAYDRQVTSANAIYLDYLTAISSFSANCEPSCLSYAGKLLLVKHRVYYALTYADQYAWLYSELMPLIRTLRPGDPGYDPSFAQFTQDAIDKIRYARNLVLLGLPFDEPAPPDLPNFFLGCRTNPQHTEWCQYCPCSCCPPCP